MKRDLKSNHAFTLIEILVVVAIIAIIGSIVIRRIDRRPEAWKNTNMINIAYIEKAVEMHYLNTGDRLTGVVNNPMSILLQLRYPPLVIDTVTGQRQWFFLLGSGAKSGLVIGAAGTDGTPIGVLDPTSGSFQP